MSYINSRHSTNIDAHQQQQTVDTTSAASAVGMRGPTTEVAFPHSLPQACHGGGE